MVAYFAFVGWRNIAIVLIVGSMAAFDPSGWKLRESFTGADSKSRSHGIGIRNAHPFAKFAKGWGTLCRNGFHKFN